MTAPLIPPVGEDDTIDLMPLRFAFNAAFIDGTQDALSKFWEAFDQLKAALTITRQQQATPCVWTEDRNGQWDTACGRKWEFINDGPTENRMHYCHGCGRPVTAVHYVETVADDDDQDEQEKGTTTL